MTADEAAKALAELVRKLVWSPHSGLRHISRSALQRALEKYDHARKRKTGFERLLTDDDGSEELPGSHDATTARPKCKHCGNQFRPRHKHQKWCSTDCRKAAFYDRQRRIRHKEKPVVESSTTCTTIDLDD
jgi:hypothetical protein